ncbi:MAG: complex I NDUFA9 subunit family protein [Hyphomicrobiales bacterium]|nr:complex I NDUFA9 subunit family protein [Hyphomicrobiales bacterium]
MAQQLVTVFGGSGFIGRHLVRVLARRGWRIRAATRRPDLAGHLQPLGAVGQIHAVQANLRYRDSVARAIEGADAVVNLVGILFESGRQRFASVQAEGARIVAEETKRAGIGSLVHLSAIGADAASPSEYARSKAQGEAAVFANVPDAVILRPSVVFGPEDQFFNRFAGLARFAPVLPLIGGGETRFQPVYVGDVAEAAARTLEGGARPGTTYELGGPAILSFRAILEYILAETGRTRPLLPLPFGLAKWQASLLEMLPNPLLTVDQVTLLERDNIVSAGAIAEGRTLEGLGITPTGIEAIVPGYLYAYRRHGQFSRDQAA